MLMKHCCPMMNRYAQSVGAASGIVVAETVDVRTHQSEIAGLVYVVPGQSHWAALNYCPWCGVALKWRPRGAVGEGATMHIGHELTATSGIELNGWRGDSKCIFLGHNLDHDAIRRAVCRHWGINDDEVGTIYETWTRHYDRDTEAEWPPEECSGAEDFTTWYEFVPEAGDGTQEITVVES